MAAVGEIDGLIREMDMSLVDLRNILNSISGFQPEERRLKLNRAQRTIQAIKTLKEAIALELRGLSSPTDKAEVRQALQHRMDTFRLLCEDYDAKKNDIDRDQLQAEAEEMGSDDGQRAMQTQTLIARGDKLQDETQEAITRMKGLAVNAEEVGTATAAKMQQQLEQMQRVGSDLDDVQFNTKRARQTAMAMARGAAGDLCIQMLCGGILLCTITIIVLVSV